MFNEDTEMLFPPRLIPQLRDLRGENGSNASEWQELVDRVSRQNPTEVDRLAFVLLMIRLGGCSTCNADSYRAMRGCTQCAQQTVRRYRGSDHELIKGFKEAREDVVRYLEKNHRRESSD